jgi:integrase
MMNKKFLPAYTPARVVRARDRWYICYYAPTEESDEPTRYRFTFNLNRIKDLQIRKTRAEDLVKKINWWLGRGFRPWAFDERKVPFDFDQGNDKPGNKLGDTNVIDALEFIREVKAKTGAKDTARSYRSHVNLLIEFLQAKKYDRLCIADFSKNLAMSYMDYRAIVKKVSNTTYNNTITNLRVMFYALKDREYIAENPFKDIPKKKRVAKTRRPFSDQEARKVITRIKKESTLLFYALLFEYACFIRPEEVRNLRFQDVDLRNGIVTLRNHRKTDTNRFKTIPDDFLCFFNQEYFNHYPGHYFIFGKTLKPHPSIPCGKSSLYRKHRKVLDDMYKTGALDDLTGLTFYSWKDTGITYALQEMKILAVQDQAGHTTPQMTLRYREKPKVNKEIKEMFKNKLIT